MRMLKPSSSIRYTGEDRWLIFKGPAFRDNPGYFRFLARSLVNLSDYDGEEFSDGDAYINKCAEGSEKDKAGNLTTWREVGTNHHIERVVSDVAKFYVSEIDY
jgi:hypothetical protein